MFDWYIDSSYTYGEEEEDEEEEEQHHTYEDETDDDEEHPYGVCAEIARTSCAF